MHETVETPFGDLRHVRLFALVDLVKLVRAERDHPDFSVDDFHTVRAIEIASRGELLRFVVHNFPHCIASRRLEAVRARFQSAVGDVKRLAVGREIVQEGAARNGNLPFRLAGFAIESPHDDKIGNVEIVAEDGHAFRRVEDDVRLCGVDPLQIVLQRVGVDARDESIVIGSRRLAVDVADEIDILIRVVQHRLRCLKAGEFLRLR